MNKRATEFVAVLTVIIVAVVLSMAQTFWYAATVPAGFQFPWVHNFISDYYYYLHLMRQGWEGWWLVTSRLTPEIFPSQFVNPLFLILGHLARIFGLTLPLTYTLARIGGGIVLLAVTYALINLAYPTSFPKRIVGLLLAAFGTYAWGWSDGTVKVPKLVHEWTEIDPLFRLSYIPHHLWAKVFMLVAFWLLVSGKVRNGTWLTVLVGVTVLAAGFSSPVVLVTLLPTVGIWLAAEAFVQFRSRRSINLVQLIPAVIAIGVALGVVWYHRQLELGVFPWNSYKLWEDAMRYPINPISYAQSFGPSLLLFVVAIGWLTRTQIGRLLLAWVASGWVMLFVLGPFIPLSNIRFLGGYQFIPIGIGAAQGLWELARLACRKQETCVWQGFWVAVVLMMAYSAVGLWASWQELYGYIQQNRSNPQVYTPNAWIEVFRFLDMTTPRQSVVLAPYTISTMTPAFTSNRVVVGHPLMTLNEAEKQADVATFFSYNNPQGSREILVKYNISYVLVDRTQPMPAPVRQLLGMEPVFENSALVVYKVMR